MVTIEANSLGEGLVKVAQFLGSEFLSQAKQNIVDYGAVDTGQLLQSGELILKPDGCIVSFGINYADYVEYGVEPHWTPHEPIVEWVKRKLRYSKEEADKVAYAIQAKIAREGIDPKPYTRNAIDQVIAKYKS